VLNVLVSTPKCQITPTSDKRGKHPAINKFKKETLVMDHIESFNPTISHYRREHAPNIRYLPSDVTITFMHQHFIEKFPELDRNYTSYEYYRCKVKEKNISFAQLGHEECELCESFNIHEHKSQILPECDVCTIYTTHINKTKKARHLYKKQADMGFDETNIYLSIDLQKVIMLPRVDSFKKVIFTKRIVAYHESFVPLGKKSKLFPFACIWHEGINARNKEDLISTFYAFLLSNRDANTVTIWLDNCSSQNKNWCLFSFLIYIVNSEKICANEINLNYFEPGHTFMSADHFHHQVELSLKHQKKTYDFDDFAIAIGNANKSKVVVKKMEHSDFFLWKDYKAQQKLTKSTNRILLKDVVSVQVKRWKFILYTKSDYDEEYSELDFLRKNVMKINGMPHPISLTKPRGILQEKRDRILQNL